MQQDSGAIEAAIIAISIIFLILATFIVMIMLVYRKRRNSHIIEKINIQANFQQEILKAQLEMQEQTLNRLSREMHDNISQVLSFVKMTLGRATNLSDDEKQQKIDQSRELISQAVADLRDLSKSISFEHIKSLGLVKTINTEVDRLNKSGLVKASLNVEGEERHLGDDRELVIFRIIQEGINNTLKYAEASHLQIALQYSDQIFNLSLQDDGKGFQMDAQREGGSGLRNIRNRANLIGATAVISSGPGKGCQIKVALNRTIEPN